jgi:hypothetical protein
MGQLILYSGRQSGSETFEGCAVQQVGNVLSLFSIVDVELIPFAL